MADVFISYGSKVRVTSPYQRIGRVEIEVHRIGSQVFNTGGDSVLIVELTLTGTVFGHDGKPREGVTVEAYHTDASGLYRSKPADSFLGDEDIRREEPKGTFASIRPLERQPDGKLRCVRDIRLPQDW